MTYEDDLIQAAKAMADENAKRRSEWASYLGGQQWPDRLMGKIECEERFGPSKSDEIVITRI